MNTLEILSGADVSGSCYLLELGGLRILFDCGSKPNNTYSEQIEIPSPETIDAVFISHAHMDHMGALAYTASVCKNAKIITTSTTADFISFQLSDTIADFIGATSPELRFHNELLCRMVMNRIETVSFNEKYQFTGSDGTACSYSFFRAGHVPGAAMIYLKIGDHTVLYSGDFSHRNTALTDAFSIPNSVRADTLVLCGLHADNPDYFLNNINNVHDTFVARIIAGFGRNKKLVVTAGQLTKGLEALAVIDNEIEAGRIPKCKVFVDDSIWRLAKHHEFQSESFRLPYYMKPLSQRAGNKPDDYENELVLLGSKKQKLPFKVYGSIPAEFSLHADYCAIVKLITDLRPANVFVVHRSLLNSTPQLVSEEKISSRTNICYTENGKKYSFEKRR